jgi:DNA-binding beta-propeller fold protein YncE
LVRHVDLSRFGGGPASVDFDRRRGGIVAVAVQAEGKTDRGTVQFFDADGDRRGSVRVGVGPDNLTFTNDGKTLLVANEGEPTDDYSVDPEGTVNVIDVRRGAPRARVRTATFDGVRLRGPVRIFGPGAFGRAGSRARVHRGGSRRRDRLSFVDAKDSPTRRPLLLSANEISGTLSVIEERAARHHR